MLPMRWNHPPCRNMDDRGVNQLCWPLITQAVSRLMGTEKPSGRRPRSSPGISPSSHTDRERLGSEPIPWTTTQTTTLAAISTNVTMGVASVGLSSR
jgi:hypothetical protein